MYGGCIGIIQAILKGNLLTREHYEANVKAATGQRRSILFVIGDIQRQTPVQGGDLTPEFGKRFP